MKIKILNYKNVINWIELPENTYAIEVMIITGDEIITAYDIYYNKLGEWDSADLCMKPRMAYYYDGEYTVVCNEENITEFNKFEDVYNRMEYYYEKDCD